MRARYFTSELRISSAVLVQVKGLGFSFHVSIHCRMSASRAATLVWTPRRMSLSVIRPKNRSTWLTHDDPVGVKWMWKRVWRGRQLLIMSAFGVGGLLGSVMEANQL